MTEKDLVKQLRELKNITPQGEWAVSARNDLLNHIEETEVSNIPASPAGRQYPISNIGRWLHQPRWTLAAALGVAVLMISSVVGAQYTVPGSPLYPVKIASEKVQGLVAANDVSFKASLVERRVQEAAKIASGKLDKEEAVWLSEYLASYNEEVREAKESGNEEEIEKLEKSVKEVTETIQTVVASNANESGAKVEDIIRNNAKENLANCEDEDLVAEITDLLEEKDPDSLTEADRLSRGCAEDSQNNATTSTDNATGTSE